MINNLTLLDLNPSLIDKALGNKKRFVSVIMLPGVSLGCHPPGIHRLCFQEQALFTVIKGTHVANVAAREGGAYRRVSLIGPWNISRRPSWRALHD